MKTCVIIDDEPLAIELIKEHVNQVQDLECIASFSNPIEGLHFLNNTGADLLFLDVQMPELTGIQMVKILGKNQKVIMTTAYEKYALDAFEHEVVDYLLKPISFERFYKSIEKFRKTQTSVVEVSSQQEDAFIFIKSEYKFIKVFYSDIHFIEGLGDYVAVHFKDKKILTLMNMKSFVEILPKKQFLRIHKSYIIAMDKIDFVERNRVIIGEQRIPVSATYQEEFWKRIQG